MPSERFLKNPNNEERKRGGNFGRMTENSFSINKRLIFSVNQRRISVGLAHIRSSLISAAAGIKPETGRAFHFKRCKMKININKLRFLIYQPCLSFAVLSGFSPLPPSS